MHARRLAASLAALSSLAGAVPAEEPGPHEPGPLSIGPRDFVLDPETTTIQFTLDAVAHEVRGTARLIEGIVETGPTAGSVAGRLVVDARSLETGNGKRDRDLHRKVLESEEHPEIVFVPEWAEGSLQPGSVSELRITGRMEIHGDTHKIEIPATVSPVPGGLDVAMRFEVPYVAWGMKDPSFFLFRVGKVVTIDIEASLRSAEGEDPGGDASGGPNE